MTIESKKASPDRQRVSRLKVLDQAEDIVERADAAENRERILRAVRRLLRKKSIEDICMDEVAELAGVGKGTLYRRFKDRASLCYALLDDDQRQLQNRALRHFELGVDADANIELTALVEAIFEFNLTHMHLLSDAASHHTGPYSEHPALNWQREHIIRLLDRRHGRQSTHALIAENVLALLSPALLKWQVRTCPDKCALKAVVLAFIARSVSE